MGFGNRKIILLEQHVRRMERKDKTIQNHANYITTLENLLNGFIGTEDVKKLRRAWLIEIV